MDSLDSFRWNYTKDAEANLYTGQRYILRMNIRRERRAGWRKQRWKHTKTWKCDSEQNVFTEDEQDVDSEKESAAYYMLADNEDEDTMSVYSESCEDMQ
jgi:hypothetical protein